MRNKDNQIKGYIHCAECRKELPYGITPKEYQNIEVGWTDFGVQVWCKRHDREVVHIPMALPEGFFPPKSCC